MAQYSSSAKEPKRLLCAPQTLASLHVALDFHGCLSFRSVLRPPWQGKNSEFQRRSNFKGSEVSASGLFYFPCRIGMT